MNTNSISLKKKIPKNKITLKIIIFNIKFIQEKGRFKVIL